MRRYSWLLAGVILATSAGRVFAEQKRSEQVLNSVVSGLLGTPQQTASPDAVYSAQERDRLVSMLQSGEYATARQGEPVDVIVYGIPLTNTQHVYTAKPIPPSQTSYHPSSQQ